MLRDFFQKLKMTPDERLVYESNRDLDKIERQMKAVEALEKVEEREKEVFSKKKPRKNITLDGSTIMKKRIIDASLYDVYERSEQRRREIINLHENGFSRWGDPHIVDPWRLNQYAREVVSGLHGTGHEERIKSLGLSEQNYREVADRVNRLMRGEDID